jgi:hypothetical protein
LMNKTIFEGEKVKDLQANKQNAKNKLWCTKKNW